MRTYTGLMVVLTLVCTSCGTKHVRFPWASKPGREASKAVTAEVETVGEKYDRTRSHVLIRKILRPTRANLDYAAYHANVVTYNPSDEEVTPAEVVPDEGKLFNGVLVPGSIVCSLSETPLTAEEKGHPLAFSPMVDVLSQWNYEKASPLDDARAAVRVESWGKKKSIQVTFQEITEVYFHEDRELWAKIEFQPWARLFENMPDEDGDGFPQIYGQLKPDLVADEVKKHIQESYRGRLLDRKEVRGWVNELASYWYPSYNTDVFDLGKNTSWPIKDTEPEVIAELAGYRVENPTVIIRGKPHGKSIYNVFLVEGLEQEKAAEKPKAESIAERLKKHPVVAILEPQRKDLRSELERNGSWKKWAAGVEPYHRQIRRKLKSRPKKLRALIGNKGFLFYRNSMDYVVGGDLQAQPKKKNPFPVIVEFKDFLKELGVDFLLVPVPTKVEVFPDKLLSGKLHVDRLPVMNPYGRKFLLELTRAGVEVVDLLPAFLKARAERKPGDELLYQPQDTHWTDRGLRLAARIVADRIKKYPWFRELSESAVDFAAEKVTFNQHGDLVSRLAPKEQPGYRPDTLVGHKVKFPDGKLYDDDPDSPVVVLGDSFTGVFQRTHCRNAGVSAHIAKQIRYPVDLVMSYGGGPGVRKTLLRRGVEDLKKRRLIVWIFTARDLYNYWEDWEPLKR